LGERDMMVDACGPIRSVLDVPFSHGTVAVNSDQPDAFSEDDIAYLQEIAQILSS